MSLRLRYGRRLLLPAALALVAVASPLARPLQASELSVGAGRAPSAAINNDRSPKLAGTQVFDPAASQFDSLLPYGAMSVVAPYLFGDFQSPTSLTFSGGGSGMGAMPQIAGLDPAVSAMLNGILQNGLLPAGGSAAAETFDVGSGENDGAVSFGAVASGGEAPVWQGPGTLPDVDTASGIQPTCEDSESADKLQAGGEYWDRHQGSAAPVQVPRGVFTHIEVGDPLGGLGPQGNPTNLPRPGAAGSWCRPGLTPFYMSSPLENVLVQIGLGAALIALLVFWLSRGIRLPA
jgi:hypothetical protein